ncbi:MAG: hypothetical protein LBS43_07470 [Prevotellaceae bacterium]|jgi:hypothetical protein|nr:hypothetical protein [Prevotellaceae bacterium]
MTVKEIFNQISKGLNPDSSIISSIGEVITHDAEQRSDRFRADILQYLPKESLAYKIVFDANRLSEKQLWAVAYELLKSQDYCEKLAADMAETAEYIRHEKARKKAKKEAKKAEITAALNRTPIRKEDNDNLVGCNVKHGAFGEGIVTSETDDKITINFKVGEKTLLKRFTKLEKI